MEKILNSNIELDKVKIIVPNNRSILYLKKAFMDFVKSPFFSPDIQTIESFIEKLSGLRSISNTEFLFSFYYIYKENIEDKEIDSFEKFFDWANILLKEFNEIDSNLISAKEIFEYNLSLKKIDEWGKNSDTELINQNLNFNKKIYRLYKAINSKLISEQSGYINGEVVTIDGGEWLKGAGQFNDLDKLPKALWKTMKKMRTRSKK